MVPMVLGELYLPLSLRGDARNIGGYFEGRCEKYWWLPKKGEVLRNCWRKSIIVPN
jgi:hypothetical protein